MYMIVKHIVRVVVIGLLIAGALGAAQARRLEPPVQSETSHGVIVLPHAKASGLARLSAGDTAVLAGTRVKVEQTDPEVGLLVSSTTLGDVNLARELIDAGIQAEINHPRHILPITPTAELFNTPQATRPEDAPNKPDFWHVEQIGADIVHHAAISGTADLIVGVIDTGVYTRHPLLGNTVLSGYDFVEDDPEPNDQVGHGTHVAGIVHSICPRCSILPVKVLDYYGGDDYTIARGIRYARQRGARIIQISLGGSAPSATMCQAVRDVEAQGAQVVIAAGNSAASDNWAVGYPALCSSDSLVVSATDRYDIPAWFSNYGTAIDLAAPGYRVWSAIPPSEYYEQDVLPASGTSMAAPQVSGAAALLWSKNQSWTASQIRDRLIATARDISVLPGIDDGYGPRLDIAEAFGLRSRPIVVGMTVDKPWTPREGSDQERTVQVLAHIRGAALASVRLAVTIGSATQQLSMTLQSGEIYSLSYVVPRNTLYRRQIVMQVVATNSAGPSYGHQESVEQDGGPLPPAVLRIVNGPARKGKPVEFMVEWPGVWNNFDFNCGGSSMQFFVPKGQKASCTFWWDTTYVVRAMLYKDYTLKEVAELAVEVRPYQIYVPALRK